MDINKQLVFVSITLTAVSIYLIKAYLDAHTLMHGLNWKTNYTHKTQIYQFLMNGVNTSRSTLSLSKSYNAHDLRTFKNNVEKGIIKFIIVRGKPYKVQFQSERKYFIDFKWQSQCNSFATIQMNNCTGYFANEDDWITDVVQVVAFFA